MLAAMLFLALKFRDPLATMLAGIMGILEIAFYIGLLHGGSA